MSKETQDLMLHAKLAEIQKELNAPKSQHNSFGNYDYRSCEDILSALKPILDGCVILLTDEIVQVGERYYVKATATLRDENEAISTTAYAREEETKKGMDASQITGSASSYARKYALNGLFAIDDTKDSDTTNTHGKTAPKQQAPRPQQSQQSESRPAQTQSDDKMSEPQRRAIFAITGQLGMTEDELKAKFNIEHVSELTKSQASNIITELNKLQGRA